jgi:hypothetical protein
LNEAEYVVEMLSGLPTTEAGKIAGTKVVFKCFVLRVDSQFAQFTPAAWQTSAQNVKYVFISQFKNISIPKSLSLTSLSL